MDFYSMKRKELQALCKKHGISANLTNLEMASKLTSVLKEKEKPITRGRSCLKDLAEIVSDNDSDGVIRQVKKVKFSPENEMIEFVDGKSDFKRKKRTARTKSRMRPVAKKGDQVVENVDSVESFEELLDNPFRVTRSRGQKSVVGGVNSVPNKPIEKKRGRRVVKVVDEIDKPPTGVVDLSNKAAAETTRVPTRRSLRKRDELDGDKKGIEEVEVVVSRKNMRQKNAKGSEEISEKEVLAADGGITQPDKALRRSKRNGAKVEESEPLNGDLGKTDLVGKRKITRLGTQLAVQDSALDTETKTGTETETEVEVRGESEQVLQLEVNLWRTGRMGNRRKSIMPQIGNEEKAEAVSGMVPQLEETVRRPSRNVNKPKSVMPQIAKRGIEVPVAEVEVQKESEMVLAPSGPLRKSRRKTLMMTSTATTKEELGTKETVGRNKSLKQSRETSVVKEGSETAEALVILDGTNVLDNAVGKKKPRKRRRDPILEDPILEEETIETDPISRDEESPRRLALKSIESETDAQAVVTGKFAGKKMPESGSKSQHLEVEAPLSEDVTAAKRKKSNSRSPGIKKDSSEEVYAATFNLKEDPGLVLVNSVETSSSKSVGLQTDYREQEMEISVSQSLVITDKVIMSRQDDREKSLQDYIPKVNEDTPDRTGNFGSRKVVDPESVKDLSSAAEAGFAETTSLAGGYPNSNQSDSMVKLKEMEMEKETSTGNHILSVHKGQNGVESKEFDRFSDPVTNELVSEIHSGVFNQSGGSKKDSEEVSTEAGKASFVDPYDDGGITSIIRENNGVEGTEKFVDAAEPDESSFGSRMQNIEVEVPLTRSILAIEELPSVDDGLLMPKVGESDWNSVLSRDKEVSNDSDGMRTGSTNVLKEVGDSIAVNREKTPVSDFEKLQSESVDEVIELDLASQSWKRNEDFKCTNYPEIAEHLNHSCNEDIGEKIFEIDGFLPVHKSDSVEGLKTSMEFLEPEVLPSLLRKDEETIKKDFEKNICLDGSSHLVTDDLKGQLAVVTESDFERNCAPVSADVKGKRTCGSSNVERSSPNISEEKDTHRPEIIHTPIVTPESFATVENAISSHLHTPLKDSDESEQGGVLKNLFVTPYNNTKANEEEETSTCGTEMKDIPLSVENKNRNVGDERFNEGESQETIGAKESELENSLHQGNPLPITSEEIIDTGIIGSDQEYQLKTLFATPVSSANTYQIEETSSHEAEMADAAITVDKTISKVGDESLSLPTSAEITNDGFIGSEEEYQLKNLFATPLSNANTHKMEATTVDNTISKVGDERFSQREPQEMIGAKAIENDKSIHKENALPTTGEQITDGCSSESWHDDQLKILFATPVNSSNLYKVHETYGHDNMVDVALSVDKTTSMDGFGRFSELETREMVRSPETYEWGFDEHWQEDHLQILFATPVDSTSRYREESLEKTLGKVRDGRSNQGESWEMVGAKESEHKKSLNRGNASATKGDDITVEVPNESTAVEAVNVCTGTLPQTVCKDAELSEEQMTAELVKNTFTGMKGADMPKEENKKGIVSPGGPLFDKVVFDHENESANRNINTPAASAGSLFEEGIGCNEISGELAEEKLSPAVMESDFYSTVNGDNLTSLDENISYEYDAGEEQESHAYGEGLNADAEGEMTEVVPHDFHDADGEFHDVYRFRASSFSSVGLLENTGNAPTLTSKPLLEVDEVSKEKNAEAMSVWDDSSNAKPGFVMGNEVRTSKELPEKLLVNNEDAMEEGAFVGNVIPCAEHGPMEFNIETHMFSSWEVNLFLGDEVDKPNAGASNTKIKYEDSKGAGEVNENFAVMLAEEQLCEIDVGYVEEKEAGANNSQLTAADVSIGEADEISKESNVAVALEGSIVAEYNENVCINVENSHVIMQDEGLTEVGKMSCHKYATAEEVGANDDYPVVGNVATAGVEDIKLLLGQKCGERREAMADQSPAYVHLCVDEGIAALDAHTGQQMEVSIQRNPDDKVEEGNSPSAIKQFYSTTIKRKNARTSLVQGTPNKLLMAGDMKENAQSFKTEHTGNLTAVKSVTKRRALQDLQKK